jgi:hypothetical protein
VKLSTHSGIKKLTFGQSTLMDLSSSLARWLACTSHPNMESTSNMCCKFTFPASNNSAEYEALLHALRIAVSLDIHGLKVHGDSLLVINQVSKDWTCQDDKMMAYCQEVRIVVLPTIIELWGIARD